MRRIDVLQLKSIDLGKIAVETIVIPVGEDREIHTDGHIRAAVKKVKKFKEFNGKKEEELVWYDFPGFQTKRVIFMGLGAVKQIDPEALRAWCGRAVKKCIQMRLSEAWMVVPRGKVIGTEFSLNLEAMLEGAFLGNHVFDKYKKEKKQIALKQVNFLVPPAEMKKNAKLPGRVESICRGALLAREWVSMPPNDKRPERFSRLIASEAKKAKLTVKTLNERTLEQKGFGALLAVAAGSSSRPRLVILEYKPQKARKTIAFVGKGVTFDAGGINLKPSGSLEDMKMDMSGAAAVAATLITVARLRPGVSVVGAIPIVENMPSGRAYRPGDIIKSHNGKTVEIGNTDAEGRLILIDTMSYVLKQYKPAVMIDLATLTGACIIALGEKIAGVFSSDDGLAESILASAEKTHERCWRMPLPEDYKEQLKSDFADINNIGNTRWGGAITAALFLSEFVEDTRWAHIDIAGPAYVKKPDAYCGAGGTGFGVRLLCDLLDRL